MQLVYLPPKNQGEAASPGAVVLTVLLGTLDILSEYAVDTEPATLRRFRDQISNIRERLSGITHDTAPESIQSVLTDLRGSLREHRDHVTLHIERMRKDLTCTSEALNNLLGAMQESGDADSALEEELSKLRALIECPSLEQIRTGLAQSTAHLHEFAERIRAEKEIHIAQLKSEIDCLHRRLEKAELESKIDSLTGVCTNHDFIRVLRRRIISGERVAVIEIRLNQFDELEPGFAREILHAFFRRLRNVIPATSVAGAGHGGTYYVIAPEQGLAPMADRIAHSCAGRYVYMQNGMTCSFVVQATISCITRGTAEEVDTYVQRLGLGL